MVSHECILLGLASQRPLLMQGCQEFTISPSNWELLRDKVAHTTKHLQHQHAVNDLQYCTDALAPFEIRPSLL